MRVQLAGLSMIALLGVGRAPGLAAFFNLTPMIPQSPRVHAARSVGRVRHVGTRAFPATGIATSLPAANKSELTSGPKW